MLYKFTNPQTPDEALERFELVELRGDRALFRFVCDMRIRPLFVYPLSELTPE